MHADSLRSAQPSAALALLDMVGRAGSELVDGALPVVGRRVRRGQKLFREGERLQAIYVVRAGTFKSSLGRDEGGEQVTCFPIAGDLLGFDALAGGIHPTTATALEDGEVFPIPMDRLADPTQAHTAKLVQKMFELASAELAREERMMLVVANGNSAARVASFLLHLSQRLLERGYSPAEFELRMSRSEIGNWLGLAAETVSRHLTAFRRQGWIEVHQRRVCLLSFERLQQ
ncbi:MAG: helix-turn-helix domain-containing protein, partial [Pseudomonadota bacterium]